MRVILTTCCDVSAKVGALKKLQIFPWNAKNIGKIIMNEAFVSYDFWTLIILLNRSQSLKCGPKKDQKIVCLELLTKQRSTLAKCKEMHPHAEPDHGQPYAMQRTALHWLLVPKYVCGPKKDLENLLTKHRSTVAIYKEMYSHAEPDHGQPYVM